jgi:hypothetical protein
MNTLTIATAQALVDTQTRYPNFRGSVVIEILDNNTFRVRFPNGRTWTLYADLLKGARQ